MKIIIVGCGNVGGALAEQLSKEGHNITVIDSAARQIREITDSCDVMGIVGNGASYNILTEADIEHADLLIAVTNADELNLLCCLIAKKAGVCHTIARVRNPVYSREISFIKEELGLSMVINPEFAAASEISRLVKFPDAIKVDTFAKGRVELLRLRLNSQCRINGLSLKEVGAKLRGSVLISMVERGDQVIIPDGNFVLRENDVISTVAKSQDAREFFRMIGLGTSRVRSTMIVGGGETTYYLARQLLAMGIGVKIIEKDKARCEELCELLPQAMVICGDGTERALLLEEGMEHTDAFITLTNFDEENIMLSLFAKSISRAKLITKVHRIAYDEIIGSLDIGSVVYPKYITAEYIIQYVRAMSNSIGSNVETLYKLIEGKAEALEFWIREDAPVVDIPLQDLQLKDNTLIACINHKGEIITPGGQDMIRVGDTVVVVTAKTGLHDIRDILK